MTAAIIEALEAQLPEATIDLITHSASIGLEHLSQRFGVSLERSRLRVVPQPSPRLKRYLPGESMRRVLTDRCLSKISAEYDLFINNRMFSTMPAKSRCSIYICMFPPLPDESSSPSSVTPGVRNRTNTWLRQWYYRRSLSSYSEVCAISEFTRLWTQRYWDIEASILYPPVETQKTLDLARKQRRILSVGRFFAGHHHKKHRPMIETFMKMMDQGLSGWEYHLVGSITPTPGTQEYIEELQAMAKGHPIFFHFATSAETLAELQNTSSIFWHATGFGEDENLDPAKMEHFGISTVEAMAHGVVPVVIAKGGQPEIVSHGQQGYLWHTLDELAAYTFKLVNNSDHRERLACAAHARSLDFGRGPFRSKLGAVLGRLLKNSDVKILPVGLVTLKAI